MNYDELVKRLTELLESAGAAAKGFGKNTWELLVEAQKATALAGLISAAIGTVFGLLLARLAWRMARVCAAQHEAAKNAIWQAYEKDREERTQRNYDGPAERAGVVVPGLAAVAFAILASMDARYVWTELPMAIAQYRHPAAFVAREAVEQLVKK